jgi:DNA repair protein RadC
MAVYLNARYELLGKRTIRIGSLNRLSVSPRDIIIPALEFNSAGVILAHNHPSGDSEPSKEDVILTKRIEKAFDIVGLSLIDHLVVARKNWVSVLEYSKSIAN